MLRDESEIYYGIAGDRHGPVEFARLCALLENGRLGIDDYIWNAQDDSWLQISEIDELRPYLPEPFLQDQPTTEPGSSAYGHEARDERMFAGFWIRAGAHLIDSFILTLPFLVWMMFLTKFLGIDPESIDSESLLADPFSTSNREMTEDMLRLQAWMYGGLAIMEWLYRAGCESSPWQSTVGKRALGLFVTDNQGYRLSFLRASGRHWAKLFSQLPMNLGFFIIAVSKNKQGFHDMLASTYVLHRRQ
jgi:uncharacterized RDD family membrane protein YckC